MTPLLIFVGIAPAVAILPRSPTTSHPALPRFPARYPLLATALSDPLLALVLLSGSTVQTALGVWTFHAAAFAQPARSDESRFPPVILPEPASAA
jgi:hypothetical protein